MVRSRFARLSALIVCGAIGLWASCEGDFSFSFTFIVPKQATLAETQTVVLPAAAAVQIANDSGSTRVTVDPEATEATLEITRTASAETQEAADALLAQMVVTITPPTAENDTLIVNAIRPPTATVDTSDFQATITEDEVTVVAIVGAAQVANYRLRITLPAGHPVSVDQGVGQVRAVGLDMPSVLTTAAGSVRSIAAVAALTVATEAGSAEIEAHRGSLDVDTNAGSVEVEIVALVSSDTVNVRVNAGSINLWLPQGINASLRALTDLGRVWFRERDFDMVTGLTETRAFVEATLGAGGAAIDLRTDTGSIDIHSF
ncbi:MAG: hypothetical protein JXA69_09145 [Phycisphaerae bacterium]|nr:hypothetical protein [Phycisphaerae bacterium]